MTLPELFERCGKFTPKPRPLWYWVFVRGSALCLLIVILGALQEAVYDCRSLPRGVGFAMCLKTLFAHFSNLDRLYSDFKLSLIGGFLFGLLGWAADYKRLTARSGIR